MPVSPVGILLPGQHFQVQINARKAISSVDFLCSSSCTLDNVVLVLIYFCSKNLENPLDLFVDHTLLFSVLF